MNGISSCSSPAIAGTSLLTSADATGVRTTARQRAEFARDEGIDAANRAVLVLDRAGWHTADLTLPDGIDLVWLPPYSPELQPAERLWPLVDEPVANRAFADLDELSDTVAARCRDLRASRARLKAHTRFHWWPPEPRPST